MTTKSTFLGLLLLTFLFSSGQKAELWVRNPEPRIGDIITIQLSFVDDSLKHVESSITKDTVWDYNGEGHIDIKRLMTKTGKYTIGPFTFVINNKTYTSNKIEINVVEKLPDDKEGFWIRQVKWNNTDYLIFEQRIDLAKKSNKKNDPYNSFADLANNVWDHTDEIVFSSSSSISPIQPTVEKAENVVGKMQVVYKISIYKFKKKKGYDGNFTLEKKNFDNFPSDINFKGFTIH